MDDIPFIENVDAIGVWDTTRLEQDLKNFIESTGADWHEWSNYNNITYTKYKDHPIAQDSGDVNLTCNLGLGDSLEDLVWAHSGRKYHESEDVNHYDLHTLNPKLHGTYIEQYYLALVKELGPVYLRIHNKANHLGLYLHKDDDRGYSPGNFRYHMVLWTHPGHQIIWTPDYFPWKNGVVPEHKHVPHKINAEFIPVTGVVQKLATGIYIHGVSSMGMGFTKTPYRTSRCHIVAIPIIPNDRYSKYVAHA